MNIKKRIDTLVEKKGRPKNGNYIDLNNKDIQYFFRKTKDLSLRSTAELFQEVFGRYLHYSTVFEIRKKLNLTK